MLIQLSVSLDTKAKLFQKPLKQTSPWENQFGRGKIVTLSWGKLAVSLTYLIQPL